MRGIGGLLVMLLIVYGVAALGGLATAKSVGTWYRDLVKPSWTPPAWVFGPAWTLLYTLMAIAAWLVLRRIGQTSVTVPLLLFGVQLAFNVAWSLLFFGARQPGWAMLDLTLLWLSIGATLLSFWGVSPAAGALLIPYLLWVSYASTLNWGIWRMNP